MATRRELAHRDSKASRRSTASPGEHRDAGTFPPGFEGSWQQYESPAATFEHLVDEELAEGESRRLIQETLQRPGDDSASAELRSKEAEALAELVRTQLLDADGGLLEGAYEPQQKFLARRESFLQAEARRKKHPTRLWLGGILLALAVAGTVYGFLYPLWEAPLLLGWPPISRILVPAVIVAALVVVFFASALRQEGNGAGMVVVAIIVAFMAALGLAWGIGDMITGLTPGLVAGFVAVVLVVFLYAVGGYLVARYKGDKGAELPGLYRAWCEELWRQSVIPALNVAINDARVHSFSLDLRFHGSVGAGRVGAAIDTAAANELREMTQGRSRGSIALSGPRGSGKSTLLQRWTSGAYVTADAGSNTVRRNLRVDASAPVGYDQKEFLVYLFGRLCEASEQWVQDFREESGEGQGLLSGRRLLRRMSSNKGQSLRLRGITSIAELEHLAGVEREVIRFVQSTTSTQELSAGITRSGMTVGAKTSEAIRRDRIPLNYPELVHEFRWFLDQAARVVNTQVPNPPRRRAPSPNPAWGDEAGVGRKGSVLIAIDELDRISDGALAQKFINDLKAVFGVPNCFFLVSVSEDALADFELSAMGLRTVFDSAFDDIVRVGYLDMDEAENLIDRLVIGVPRPFIALLYVFSGGLARQLLRIARRVAETEHSDGTSTLGSVSAQLVRWQAHNTVRAATDRLFGATDTAFGEGLLRVLDEMGSADDFSSAALEQKGRTLRGLEPGADEKPAVTHLRDEVAAMCNYLATVREVFDDDLDEADFERRRDHVPDGFDALARVRRHLGANPHRADELLEPFHG